MKFINSTALIIFCLWVTPHSSFADMPVVFPDIEQFAEVGNNHRV